MTKTEKIKKSGIRHHQVLRRTQQWLNKMTQEGWAEVECNLSDSTLVLRWLHTEKCCNIWLVKL